MTSVQLASMSTALWIVATVSLFIVLAEWSSGTSWGLTASIVRGVRGWSDREGLGAVTSPSGESLRPILDPYASLRRSPPASGPVPAAEVIELGVRSLPR
jgi:hypothetical protein